MVSQNRDSLPDSRYLNRLLEYPTESPAVEYKDWLDLTTNHGRATLAKHAIALANHGGGHIVLGFDESGHTLQSHGPPAEIAEVTQDRVNESVRRYVDPAFHCQLRLMSHPETAVEHPIIVVPGGFPVPVMSKRDESGVIRQYRCYIRKQGPRSEEPQNGAEWRELLDRCVREGRAEMLDAIRSIVMGRTEFQDLATSVQNELRQFCSDGRTRWQQLTSSLEQDDPARFPVGYYEVGVFLGPLAETANLNETRRKLDEARASMPPHGWPLFLNIPRDDMKQRPQGDCLEAWLGLPYSGRTLFGPDVSDFWQASKDGKLYSIRGFWEDGPQTGYRQKCLHVPDTLRRFAELLVFAARYAQSFGEAGQFVVSFRFTGLEGRNLIVGRSPWPWQRVCRTDTWETAEQVAVQQVDENLVELVHTLSTPLFEMFDLYELSIDLVRDSLQEPT